MSTLPAEVRQVLDRWVAAELGSVHEQHVDNVDR